jgi:hypothetical protein
MRYFFAIGLLAFALVGCAASRHQAALQIWRSPDSTLKQRAHAVSKLVPKGASQQTVKSILGTSGAWTWSHGPNTQVIWSKTGKFSFRPLPDYDVWSLEYEFPRGGVALYFDPPTAMGNRFVSASAFTSSK